MQAVMVLLPLVAAYAPPPTTRMRAPMQSAMPDPLPRTKSRVILLLLIPLEAATSVAMTGCSWPEHSAGCARSAELRSYSGAPINHRIQRRRQEDSAHSTPRCHHSQPVPLALPVTT